jgi:hypothetical protein
MVPPTRPLSRSAATPSSDEAPELATVDTKPAAAGFATNDAYDKTIKGTAKRPTEKDLMEMARRGAGQTPFDPDAFSRLFSADYWSLQPADPTQNFVNSSNKPGTSYDEKSTIVRSHWVLLRDLAPDLKATNFGGMDMGDAYVTREVWAGTNRADGSPYKIEMAKAFFRADAQGKIQAGWLDFYGNPYPKFVTDPAQNPPAFSPPPSGPTPPDLRTPLSDEAEKAAADVANALSSSDPEAALKKLLGGHVQTRVVNDMSHESDEKPLLALLGRKSTGFSMKQWQPPTPPAGTPLPPDAVMANTKGGTVMGNTVLLKQVWTIQKNGAPVEIPVSLAVSVDKKGHLTKLWVSPTSPLPL